MNRCSTGGLARQGTIELRSGESEGTLDSVGEINNKSKNNTCMDDLNLM